MNYQVTVRTLTPLHIGSGAELLRDFDYVTKGNRTFVLDQDAVLAEAYARTQAVPTKPAGMLIDERELRDDSRLVRYVIEGATHLNQLHEQIKDVQNRCYLPGSSLKGALRTVLMAHAIRSKSFTPDAASLQPKKETASSKWEDAIFGDDPNHDLLRALQITDSTPIAPSPLMIVEADAFSASDTSPIPIAVEAIKQNTRLTLTIHLEDWLLKDEQARKLGWLGKTDWLTQLPTLANTRMRERLEQERAFAAAHKFDRTLQAIETLLSGLDKLKPNQFLLQMGWGTGWTGTTIGGMLEPAMQLEVRTKYQLGKPRKAYNWKPEPNQPFPKSRRLHVARGKNANAEPGVPLGWVVVTLEQK
jgi:CRISPR-associated protein Csm5